MTGGVATGVTGAVGAVRAFPPAINFADPQLANVSKAGKIPIKSRFDLFAFKYIGSPEQRWLSNISATKRIVAETIYNIF